MSHARPHGRTGATGAASAWLALALVSLVATRVAHAQEDAPPPTTTVGALAADHSLVLRPAPSLREIAFEVREILALRTPIVVVLGADTPEDAPDVVNEGEVGIALTDARTTQEILEGQGEGDLHVRIVLGAPDRVTYATELTTSPERPASARSIALAILALRDSALVGRDPSVPPDPNAPAYTYRVPHDGPLGPHPSLVPALRPAFVFRFLLGVSAARSTALVGFGVGVGLCLSRDCLLLEADLPLLFEDRNAPPSARIDYRPSVLGLRVQLRPIVVGDVSFGFAIGPILRIGNAYVREMTTTFTTPGVRGTLVMGWEFVRRFECVIELGVDAALELARLPSPGVVLLEDVVTPWAILGLRVRP
ncbi:MAG: hypothetical protein J0L92_04940 [Deltaproteobacteria bacterium]|nr:hypothetical protein [Deltaproteobacteria bacterium]